MVWLIEVGVGCVVVCAENGCFEEGVCGHHTQHGQGGGGAGSGGGEEGEPVLAGPVCCKRGCFEHVSAFEGSHGLKGACFVFVRIVFFLFECGFWSRCLCFELVLLVCAVLERQIALFILCFVDGGVHFDIECKHMLFGGDRVLTQNLSCF